MENNEQDNILYLKSTSSTVGEEVVVSARTPELPMETKNINKTLLAIMIVIGVIIIILLLRPRYDYNRAVQYSYGNTNMFTASAVPFSNYTYTTSRNTTPGTYSIIRTYPQKSYTYTTTPTYSNYLQTTYQPYPGETMFPDGCTMTSPYSLTTGEPCS